ncbi:MAG: hypothetical protein SF097_18650 [Acidobacteriota bacterium]|nr:hypothetical protein [Acidobacteriota bacterium]
MNNGWYVVIGAAIGFFGAIVAALLNNRENAKRLDKQIQHDARRHELQLDHDAEQQRLDRERTLQREIYIGVVEALAKWQEYLINFADPDISNHEHRQILQGASQQISKAYLIGTSDTLKSLDSTNLFFNENGLALAQKRLEVTLASQMIAQLEIELRETRERIDQLISAAQIVKDDKANLDIFLSSFQSDQLKAQQLQTSLNQSRIERDLLNADILKEASRIANEFAIVSFDALLSARRELGLDLTASLEKELRESVTNTALRISNNVRDWVEVLSTKYMAEDSSSKQNSDSH